MEGNCPGLRIARSICDWSNHSTMICRGVDAVPDQAAFLPELAADMAADRELHRAGLGRDVAERHPGRDVVERAQAEIGRILVAGGNAFAARLLDEETAGVEQDVRAEQVFDGVEDCRRARELVDPAAHEMQVAAEFPVDVHQGTAKSLLGLAQLLAVTRDVRRAQRIQRIQIAVGAVIPDLFGTQLLRHCCALLHARTNGRHSARARSQCGPDYGRYFSMLV